jgi:hypothetical protein
MIQPPKHILRGQIYDLQIQRKQKLKDLNKAHFQLDYANCRIAVLEAKIERLKELAQALLIEADRDISDDVWQRFMGDPDDMAA